jgi:hypothetical protein
MTALCVAALGAAFVSAPVAAADTPGLATQGSAEAATQGVHPYFNTLPSNLDFEALRRHAESAMASRPDAFVSPPIWYLDDSSSGFIDAWNHVNYGNIYFMGAVPNKPVNSNIAMNILLWRLKFSNGFVTDPTTPSCGENASVYTRFLESPLLNDVAYSSNGVALGSRQYIDAFQEAELHGFAPAGYHTNFINYPKYARVITLSVPKADGFAGTIKGCSRPVAEMSQTWFNTEVQKVIQALKFSHAFFTFNLLNNTVMYGTSTKDCCIIGYHSAYGSSSFAQIYGVGSYVAPQWGFKGLDDVAALSHEVGEAVNDPVVQNPTPAWGHIGQVSGCQLNFEVGDPLSGTEFAVPLHGFTYHLQDLAFFSWFYRGTAANKQYLGTGGKYSFRGTFTSKNLQNICKT